MKKHSAFAQDLTIQIKIANTTVYTLAKSYHLTTSTPAT